MVTQEPPLHRHPLINMAHLRTEMEMETAIQGVQFLQLPQANMVHHQTVKTEMVMAMATLEAKHLQTNMKHHRTVETVIREGHLLQCPQVNTVHL